MSRNYVRPELQDSDLSDFMLIQNICINPTIADVASILKKVQGGSRKNIIDIDDIKLALEKVLDGNSDIESLGKYNCRKPLKNNPNSTIINIVRLTSNLVGFTFVRDSVDSTGAATLLCNEFDVVKRLQNPASWYNRIISLFWTHLSDDEIDEIESNISRYVLECSRSKSGRRVEIRKRVLNSIYRGVKPEIISEVNDGNIKNLNDYKNITDFSIHLSFWTGSERIFDQPQLVLSIRNISIHHEFSSSSVEHQYVSKELKKIASKKNRPGTTNTVGFFRVHIDDDNKICFVDEVQSDILDLAVTLDQDAAKEFVQKCQDWSVHGFCTILRWADEIGYKVGIHSIDSAKVVKGDFENKWNKNYHPLIN